MPSPFISIDDSVIISYFGYPQPKSASALNPILAAIADILEHRLDAINASLVSISTSPTSILASISRFTTTYRLEVSDHYQHAVLSIHSFTAPSSQFASLISLITTIPSPHYILTLILLTTPPLNPARMEHTPAA